MSEPPCKAELEQRRLLLLNSLAEGTRRRIPDGRCGFCYRPAATALCSVCEERRQMLSARYPTVTVARLRPVSTEPDLSERLPYRDEE